MQIKKELMRLWKDIFHDSDDYIRLIFDNYFSLENVAYHESEGRIVSGLLAVPYTFGGYSTTEANVKGVYLCGLATEEKFRRKGIMRSLLHEIESRFCERGFAFSFLIPADAGLRRYYFDRGYVDAFYRREYRYVASHDFAYERRNLSGEVRNDNNDIITVFDGKNDPKLPISDFCNKVIGDEENKKCLTLVHSEYDVKIAVKESLISGNKIYVSYHYDKNLDSIKITGICFCDISNNDDEVIIKRFIYDDKIIYCNILEKVANDYSGRSITVYSEGNHNGYDDESVTKKFGIGESGSVSAYIDAESKADLLSESYGMIKILNFDEILKFAMKTTDGLKYPILIKQPMGSLSEEKIIAGNNEALYIFKNGKVEKHKIPDKPKMSVCSEMRLQEAGELFWRKHKLPEVSSAVGIPAIPTYMSLMLD